MQLEDQQFTKWLRRPTELIASAWFLLASAGQYIVAYGIAILAQLPALFGFRIGGDALSLTGSTIMQLCLFMLPVMIYLARHDGVEQSMRLNAPRWDALLLAFLAAPLGVMASDKLTTWWMLLIESLGGQLYYTNGVPVPTTLPQLGISLILFGLLPGVCEEIFFRGGLMGAWERRGTRQGLVITSVLFALLHGSILGLPVQLIMGFVLGYIVILSNSLFVGMVYHFAHNSTILILSYLSRDSAALIEKLTLAEQIQSTVGYAGLSAQTIIWAALYAGILFLLIYSQKKRGAQIDKVVNGDKEPVSWQELIVLLAGLLTVGITLMSDLLAVCGLI